ncbi:MAG: hypothetical protein QUS13_07085 [Smithella sp.]|nr:hypothetical protein [Smithella sp.]
MRRSISYLVILVLSANLAVAEARTADSRKYSQGKSKSSETKTDSQATPADAGEDLSDRTFTFAVWLQDAIATFNKKTIAQNYKDIGINTFVGLWKWPAEDWTYRGFSVATAKALKDAGMKAYAGNNKAAVDWINNHPEFQDTVVGYLLGDEPDMNRNSGVKSVADANTPLAWKARGDALRALDKKRPIYANFGKPIAKDSWYGKEYGAKGSTKEKDFSMYVSPTTVLSSDYYGITDPYEQPRNHGIWTYGRSIRNTKKYAGGRTVWGFVEASGPWKNASSDKWMYQKMQPTLIMPIVWNMVINGAQGIVYFCHDFSPGGSNKGKFGALREPGIPEAIRSANESVMRYGAVLKTPDVPGTVAKTSGGVNVITLTKKYKGVTYIFAMGDGNPNYRDGLAVDANISVAGETGDKSATVMNESRRIVMTNGILKDYFKPYEIHIYRINN